MKKIYNKLVRDNIPKIIVSHGKTCDTEILNNENYIKMLDEKLNEECAEYQVDKNLEELADILEVVYAIAKAKGYTLEELERLRKEKAQEKGTFNDKILLKEVVDLNDKHFIMLMKEFLEKKELLMTQRISETIKRRENNELFSFDDHIRGLVYSLLSNQRPWIGIMNNIDKIEDIFLGFNKEKILCADVSRIEKQIKDIKCGNRKINAQMQNLKGNISTLERIEDDFGSLDAFLLHKAPYEVVKLLSNNKSDYKLKEVGEPLAWEYIRNLGIDGAKPDVHLRRIFGSERLGLSNKTEAGISEVLDIVSKIKDETGFYEYQIDAVIWSFCSKDFGNICTSNPKCSDCVIRKYCKQV